MTETTDQMIERISRHKAQCHCGAPAGDPCRGLASAQMILPHVGRPNLAGPDSETTQELTPTCHGDCCAWRTTPWPAALDPHRAQPGYTPRPVVTESDLLLADESERDRDVCNCESYDPCKGECCGIGNCTCSETTVGMSTVDAFTTIVTNPWPELEPGSHTAGLVGPFHRYAECTNDHCPIHPD